MADPISINDSVSSLKGYGWYKYLTLDRVSNTFINQITYRRKIYVNGSQLAKMKKSIPDMSLPWNL